MARALISVKLKSLFILWIIQGTFRYGYFWFAFVVMLVQVITTTKCKSYQTSKSYVKNEPGGRNPVKGDVVLIFKRILFHNQFFSHCKLTSSQIIIKVLFEKFTICTRCGISSHQHV